MSDKEWFIRSYRSDADGKRVKWFCVEYWDYGPPDDPPCFAWSGTEKEAVELAVVLHGVAVPDPRTQEGG